MKAHSKLIKIILLTVAIILFESPKSGAQIFEKVKEQVKQTADQRIQDKAAKMTNTSADKADTLTNKTAKKIKTVFKSKSKTSSDQANTNANNSGVNSTAQNQPADTNGINNSNQKGGSASLTVYQNYDFIPGDKIVFADDFMDDQIGEFPSHWGLIKGQGTINQSGDKRVFNILQGNYAVMKPLVKNKEYLEDAFTIEFDYFSNTGDDCGYGSQVFFIDPTGDDGKYINVGRYKSAASGYFANEELGTKDQDGVTIDQSDEDFYNHWHHIAIAYKKPQMKVYIDQTRVLVIPNIGFQPKGLEFGGIAGDEKCPIGITNVRIANGGNQNMLSSIFSGGNVFITHGITFDINKSILKPESMGVLNQIYAYLNQNKDVKIEIDGHTDNSGNAASNLSLSQERAEAVKAQLTSMGIDGSRLTTKGFGDTKPIASNDTPEGKAINRRVALVRL